MSKVRMGTETVKAGEKNPAVSEKKKKQLRSAKYGRGVAVKVTSLSD